MTESREAESDLEILMDDVSEISSPQMSSFVQKTQNMKMMITRSQKNTSKVSKKRAAKTSNAIIAAANKVSQDTLDTLALTTYPSQTIDAEIPDDQMSTDKQET